MEWEDDIRKILDKRTIKPSESSWELLADRLHGAQGRKNRAIYWGVGIVASLVVSLSAITIFLHSSDEEVQRPILVETQNVDIEQDTSTVKSRQDEQYTGISSEAESIDALMENDNMKLQKTQPKLLSLPKTQAKVAENNVKHVIPEMEDHPEKELFGAEKKTEMVSQADGLGTRGNTLTDADIDALLFSAQQKIAKQKDLKEGVFTVNPKILLQEVEYELEKSFRIKMFEVLKNSYETVKTAVVERHP